MKLPEGDCPRGHIHWDNKDNAAEVRLSHLPSNSTEVRVEWILRRQTLKRYWSPSAPWKKFDSRVQVPVRVQGQEGGRKEKVGARWCALRREKGLCGHSKHSRDISCCRTKISPLACSSSIRPLDLSSRSSPPHHSRSSRDTRA
jgi:hypothetical protein